MSIGFNWFKSYEINIDNENPYYEDVQLKYMDGGSTSHSGGNIGIIQDWFEKYTDKRIPTICEDFIHSESEILDLINPSEMSTMCQKILDNLKNEKINEKESDMIERIVWFKKLSDEGYFISYDYE